ncbi:extracellular calcium-sensing receptor-like [Tubulanus polymorphus]|uniref:extracellular calcium-sensing receptor-like n=1 Tax=Tubulanus polymorphus TaxID=672921 RepID=UPI003DA3B0DE
MTQCRLRSRNSAHAYSAGDYIIGGLFPLHTNATVGKYGTETCTDFNVRAVTWVQAMMYAIDLVNSDPVLLPNISLGYDIRDDCNQMDRTTEYGLEFALGSTFNPVMDTYFGTYQNQIDVTRTTLTGRAVDGSDCQWDSIHNAIAPVIGVVGAGSSSSSMTLNHVLSARSIPQVSFSSTSMSLSDKTRFPTFLRTVPSDRLQVQALCDLVRYFGWSYISTVASDDIYGKFGIEAFKTHAKKYNICVAVNEVFESSSNPPAHTLRRIVRKLVDSSEGQKAKAVLLYCSNHHAKAILQMAADENVTGITWIASESWGDYSEILQIEPSVVRGIVGLIPAKGELTDFMSRLRESTVSTLAHTNPWFDHLLQYRCGEDSSAMNARTISFTTSKIRYKTADEHDKLAVTSRYCFNFSADGKLGKQADDLFETGKVAYVIDAVFAFAHALHQHICSRGGACDATKRIDHVELLKLLRKVEFPGVQGYVKFNRYGDIQGRYVVVNVAPDKNGHLIHKQVGGWNGLRKTRPLRINDQLVWNDGSTVAPISRCSEDCEPGTVLVMGSGSATCCWKCIPCDHNTYTNGTNFEGECLSCVEKWMSNQNHTGCVTKPFDFLRYTDFEAIVIFGCCGLSLIVTIFTVSMVIKYRDTPIIKGSNVQSCYVILFSIGLCSGYPLMHIGMPNTTKCTFQPLYFGFVFTLCLSILLLKTRRILMIFNSKMSKVINLRLKKTQQERRQALFVLILVGAQVVLWGVCVVVWRPAVYEDFKPTDKIITSCDSNWLKTQIVVMVYVVLLSLVCTAMAFKARKLPENFNEARYLSFAVFLICLVWIVTLPSFFSVIGRNRSVLISFAVIFAAVFILGFLFFPKIRIILFHAEKNSSAYVRSQTAQISINSAAADEHVSQHSRHDL